MIPVARLTMRNSPKKRPISSRGNYKDTICRRMEVMSASRQQDAQKPTPAATAKPGTPAPKPPKIMTVRRYDLCSVKRLQSKEDIDKYVEAIREKLMKTLESCDGVQIN